MSAAEAKASPSVSVVVPTYNRAGALRRVLEPILADPAAGEVIVVIDGARDGSLELLREMAGREPRLRPLFIENSGEMAARAAGAEAARSEVVLFLDDDVLAEPGLAAGHGAAHAARERTVVVGYMPVSLPERRSPADFATRIYAREYEGRCAIWEQDPRSVLRTLWAGNFSMRRSDCLAVGLPNPRYTERYHPDRDFGLRCLQYGLDGVFDRSLRAVHLHERGLAAFARDAQSQGASRILMPALHPGTVPSPRAEEFERDLPWPLRRVVALARRPRAYSALSSTLSVLVAGAGRARVWPAQDRAGRLLRRIEQQHGAIEQANRRR